MFTETHQALTLIETNPNNSRRRRQLVMKETLISITIGSSNRVKNSCTRLDNARMFRKSSKISYEGNHAVHVAIRVLFDFIP